MHLPQGLSLAQVPCKMFLWKLWAHWSQNRVFRIASLTSIEVTGANSPHSRREEGFSSSASWGGGGRLLGAPFTQELGARAGQGAKCLPHLHSSSAELRHIWPCLSTNSTITPITPSSIFSSCRWSFTLSKRGAQVKLPSPVPFPNAVGTLLLPLAALCITDMAVLELETTAGTGAHTVSTNLVHPCKCRNYMSVEPEELPLVTETQAEKVC